jgi:hypothetical protein
MFRSANVAAAVMALLIISADVAMAGGGCPPGYTPQDGICQPYRGPYVRRDYGYRDDYRVYRRGKPCPEGYTVQHGRCEPYRGPYYR